MSQAEDPQEKFQNSTLVKRKTSPIRFLIYVIFTPIGLIVAYYIIFKTLWILTFRIELIILDMIRFWNWLGLGDWVPLL